MSTSRRGRPPDEAKRQAMLDAAQRCFLERGYDGCSIEAVAGLAGVSKVTVYAHFHDKTGLFRASLAAFCAQFEQFSTAISPDLTTPDRLRAFAELLFDFLYRPEMLAFERHLSAATARDPAVGAAFLDAGPGRVRAALFAIISDAYRAGELAFDDPALAAELFIGMVKGSADLDWHYRAHFDRAQALRRIDAAISLILRPKSERPRPSIRLL